MSSERRDLSTSCNGSSKFRLTLDTINPYVKDMEYAVRGKMPQEASKIEKAIQKGTGKYEFERVLHCNIGDCHAMGQKPLTFVRQLLAACTRPEELDTEGLYPEDVKKRARLILDNCGGKSIGAYSESRGIRVIREDVADFISERDGFPCSYESVYLLNGASEGIKTMLFITMDNTNQNKRTGILIPRPQYPLYSAAIAQLNAVKVSYILDEDQNWSINIDELRNTLHLARETCEPRVMVVINPGNPTGQYITVENMREVIRFCYEEGLLLFTDEVYQENVYNNGKFLSFRKVLHNMGAPYSSLQMVSFNSTSKGFFGECGIRGGYMHIRGMDSEVMKQIYKNVSVNLCPNTPGQIVTDALVKRPQPGDPSYELYRQELDVVLKTLAHKASLVYSRMNKIPGVSCSEVQGAMYAYPRVDIPDEALEDAMKEDPDMKLDMYYCLEFLRQKGVCVVPGSGFGKLQGKWHFRTTILPPIEQLEDMLTRFEDFHVKFLRKYGRNV